MGGRTAAPGLPATLSVVRQAPPVLRVANANYAAGSNAESNPDTPNDKELAMTEWLLVPIVVLLTEWGLCATHVHWDNPRWKAHLLDLIAERCQGPWRFRLHRYAEATRHLNLDLFHVASMAAHYPIIGLVLYHIGSWPLAIACAVGAQLVWRIVIHRSGRGWQSWWLRLARKALGK